MRFEGRLLCLRLARLSAFHCSPPGQGQSSLVGQPSFFRILWWLPGRPLHICPLVPGTQRALLFGRPVGQSGERGAQGRARWRRQEVGPSYPGSSGRSSQGRPRTRRRATLWEGPRIRTPQQSWRELLRARLVPVGTRSPERGRSCAQGLQPAAAEPDLRPEPWLPREPALGEDRTNHRHRGSPLLKQVLDHPACHLSAG